MQLHYGQPPINYINGVPAHLAGEWPGIKSCKFHSYRKIIYPLSQGVIFNENEPPLLPKRKLLGPGPSPEWEFRPCCKFVPKITEKVKNQKGLKYIPFPTQPSIRRMERRHKFPYKEQLENDKIENLKKMTNEQILLNENHYLINYGGFLRKDFNLTNQELSQMTFVKKPNGRIEIEKKYGNEIFNNLNTLNRAQRKQLQLKSDQLYNTSSNISKTLPQILTTNTNVPS